MAAPSMRYGDEKAQCHQDVSSAIAFQMSSGDVMRELVRQHDLDSSSECSASRAIGQRSVASGDARQRGVACGCDAELPFEDTEHPCAGPLRQVDQPIGERRPIQRLNV